jgi:hypothetical protein
MAANSSKPNREFTLQGLIFWPDKSVRKAGNFFTSVHAWATGGKKNNSVIYDTIDMLNDCNIAVCDAAVWNGMWVRAEAIKPASKTTVSLSKRLVVPTRPARSDKQVKGISKSDAKDHHKMNYK